MGRAGTVRLPIVYDDTNAPRRPSLLETIREEQHDLSAVERFARAHESGGEPLQARYYRDLLPATSPGPGQQYGFEVDLDACTGCKACVTACHQQNGLSEGETWRKVGLVLGGAEGGYQQTVTTACHHCLEPACLNGCPVAAYEKDPVTGIVKHLDDQCIGCQYCTLTCPYEVPTFVASKGIVRKCDMCSGRLAEGEAPACVQACPNGAIAIRVVATAEVRPDGQLVPDAPDSSITRPTTRYVTQRHVPEDAGAADRHALRPSANHAPLVAMLVLTQLAVGVFVFERVVARSEALRVDAGALRALGLASLALGLVASVLHLGRPSRAWKAFLGLRTSWLSREILAFGALFGLALPYAASPFVGLGAWSAHPALGDAVALVGLGAIGCSAMLYHVTHKPLWRLASSGARFLGVTFSLGLGATLATMQWTTGDVPLPARVLLVLGSAVFLAHESRALRAARDTSPSPARDTARLLLGPLAPLFAVRVFAAVFGAVAALVEGGAVAGVLGLLVASLAERTIFFRAARSRRMPGGLP